MQRWTYDIFESFLAGFAERGGALGSVDTELLREICGGSNQRFECHQGSGGTVISMEICGSIFTMGYLLIECILDTI